MVAGDPSTPVRGLNDDGRARLPPLVTASRRCTWCEMELTWIPSQVPRCVLINRDGTAPSVASTKMESIDISYPEKLYNQSISFYLHEGMYRCFPNYNIYNHDYKIVTWPLS